MSVSTSLVLPHVDGIQGCFMGVVRHTNPPGEKLGGFLLTGLCLCRKYISQKAVAFSG